MTSVYLLLFVAFTTGLFAITAIRRKIASWAAISVAFAIASVVGYAVAPDRAAPWIATPWAILFVAPLVVTAHISTEVAARRYRRAHRLAVLGAVLHPFPQQRGWIELTRAWLLISDGKIDEAEAIMQSSTALGRDLVMFELLRVRQRWPEVAATLAARGNIPLDDSVVPLQIRALGETGELEAMCERYRLYEASRGDELGEELATCQLFVSAFLGRRDLVELVCSGPLRHYSPAIRQFWEATALAAAGELEAARAMWTQLATEADWRIRSAAEYRLANSPARAPAIGAELTDTIGARLRDAMTYATGTATAAAPARISYGFAAVLVGAHVVTLVDPDWVYGEGIFYSTAVLDHGQWWRVATAMFLHAGWLHLGLNVVALLYLGPFVERFLGRVQFVLVAALGGIAGFCVLAALDALGLRAPNAALGASGAVMALIGASTAIFLRGSIQRSRAARTRLVAMLGFVVLQTVFDAVAPQVSMTGHLTGLLVGFAIGLIRPRAAR